MKSRRILPLLLVLVLLVTTFASCGGNKPAETTPETKAETTAETVKETVAETVPETKPEETKAETLPETKSEETEAPETKAPETEAPETKAPETKAPETKAPETKAPETKAPETKAPETKAPETKAPETKAPETKAPETKAPETKPSVETIIPNDDKTIKVPTMNTKLTGAPAIDTTRPTATGTVIHVKAGATGGDGSEAKPFASLSEALASVKKLSQNKGRVVTIVLASDEYFLDAPITLDASYQNYVGTLNIICNGKSPATIGAWKKITGWSEGKVNGVKAFVADLPAGMTPSQFFAADGSRLARPRIPETGFLRTTGTPGYAASLERQNPWSISTDHAVTFTVGEVPALSQPENVVFIAPHYWACDVLSLESIDVKKGEMYFSQRASIALIEGGKGTRYYLDNVFEALNAPGEVYADTKAGKIYYIPKSGESAASFYLYASDLESFLNIDSLTSTKVAFVNIAFVGSDWSGTGRVKAGQGANDIPGAVSIQKSKNIFFFDCRFEHIGNYGMKLLESCSNIVVDRCVFSDLGAGGIDIAGGGKGSSAQSTLACSTITFTNNTIAHYGRIYADACGILARFVSRSTLSHNAIYDGYYTGISVGWHWGFDGSSFESGTRFNLISYNHIYNLGQGVMSDLGGIYTLGAQTDSYYLNNLIHDIAHNTQGGYGGWGIYPDEGSSNMVFQNNIIYNTTEQPFRIHYGQNNYVDNNIIAFGGNGAFDVGRDVQQAKNSGQTQQSAQLTHNILVTNKQPIYSHEPTFYWMTDSTNLVWDYSGKIGCGSGRKYTVEKMKAGGLFKNVGVADPLFVDPFNGNFTLSADSPAFKMGFKAIDMSTVGPQ